MMRPLLAFLACAVACAAAQAPWMDARLDPAARAKALIAQMTTAEKIAMLHGPATGDCCECQSSPLCNYTGPFVRGFKARRRASAILR